MNRGVVIMTMTTRNKWDGKCRCRRHDGSLSKKYGGLSMKKKMLPTKIRGWPFLYMLSIPSGKLTYSNYGKSPFSMGKSTINGILYSGCWVGIARDLQTNTEVFLMWWSWKTKKNGAGIWMSWRYVGLNSRRFHLLDDMYIYIYIHISYLWLHRGFDNP